VVVCSLAGLLALGGVPGLANGAARAMPAASPFGGGAVGWLAAAEGAVPAGVDQEGLDLIQYNEIPYGFDGLRNYRAADGKPAVRPVRLSDGRTVDMAFPYPDSKGFCTRGIGILVRRSGCTAADMQKGQTRAEVNAEFAQKAKGFADALRGVVRRPADKPLSQRQFNALTSFIFNSGVGHRTYRQRPKKGQKVGKLVPRNGIYGWGILDAVNSGDDQQVAGLLLGAVGSKERKNSPGLVARRGREASEYQGIPFVAPKPSPPKRAKKKTNKKKGTPKRTNKKNGGRKRTNKRTGTRCVKGKLVPRSEGRLSKTCGPKKRKRKRPRPPGNVSCSAEGAFTGTCEGPSNLVAVGIFVDWDLGTAPGTVTVTPPGATVAHSDGPRHRYYYAPFGSTVKFTANHGPNSYFDGWQAQNGGNCPMPSDHIDGGSPGSCTITVDPKVPYIGNSYRQGVEVRAFFIDCPPPPRPSWSRQGALIDCP
jgi:GH24 family phage-related lysozyme (muramidase)